MRYIVFFASVSDGEEGIFVDYAYFGGMTYSREEAEILGKNIVNDKSLPGAILIKIVPVANTLNDAMSVAMKYFNCMAKDMYEVEDSRQRKK